MEKKEKKRNQEMEKKQEQMKEEKGECRGGGELAKG